MDWSCSRTLGAKVVKDLLKHELPHQTLLNINFPDCAPDKVEDVIFTKQGRRDQAGLSVEPRKDTRGQSYFWLGFAGRRSDPEEGTDLHAVFNKKVSVTPLNLDMTDHSTLLRLKSES